MREFEPGASTPGKGETFKDWPRVGRFTAMLDGDIVIYSVGTVIDEDAMNRHFAHMNRTGGDLESSTEWHKAKEHMDSLINNYVKLSGADSLIVFMTGKENFRYKVAFTKGYKANRANKPKPMFFHELTKYLYEKYDGVYSKNYEADDLMSIFQRDDYKRNGGSKHLCGCITISKDKDLLIFPGWHMDMTSMVKRFVEPYGTLDPHYKMESKAQYEDWRMYGTKPVPPEDCNSDYSKWEGLKLSQFKAGPKKGQFKTKRMKVGYKKEPKMKKLAGTGLMFFYAQMIMGDNSDNIPGIPGIGPVGAFEALQDCKSEKELYLTVYRMYKDKYGFMSHEAQNCRGGSCTMKAYERMLEQGRLLHMATKFGKLWQNKHNCPLGSDDGAWKDEEDNEHSDQEGARLPFDETEKNMSFVLEVLQEFREGTGQAA